MLGSKSQLMHSPMNHFKLMVIWYLEFRPQHLDPHFVSLFGLAIPFESRLYKTEKKTYRPVLPVIVFLEIALQA